jgi:hypothetical protein
VAVNESLPERCLQFDEPKDDVAAALAAVAGGRSGTATRMVYWRRVPGTVERMVKSRDAINAY